MIGCQSYSDQADGRWRRHHNSSLSSTAASNSLVEDMANFGGPTQLKRTLGLQQDRYSQYIGATTDFEPSLINLSTFDPQDESLLARGTLRKVSDNDVFLMLPDYTTPGYEHIAEDVAEVEETVAPHGRRLIDVYFTVVHPSFPIIQKAVFLEKYERDPHDFSPPLLAAMYLLAINWWDQDEELARHPRPDVARLERLVRTTLADAMYRPKLSTVQAGLILSQRPEGDQWAPTAQLVAIAQELGLHLDCTAWKIPQWEKGLRKRLAWALYMQDKWGALVHGRPSHIFQSNWAVQPLAEHDFPEVDWDEKNMQEGVALERGRMVFTQMVLLTKILAEILDTFYTLEAQAEVGRISRASAGRNITAGGASNNNNSGAQPAVSGAHHVLNLAKPIQLKLKEWYQALPAAIRMENSSAFGNQGVRRAAHLYSPRFNPIGYLHLAYFATEITLHRRIIRSLADSPEFDTFGGANGVYGGGTANGNKSINGAGSSNRSGTNDVSGDVTMGNSGAAVGPSNGVPPAMMSTTPTQQQLHMQQQQQQLQQQLYYGGTISVASPQYVNHICRNAAKARLISAMDFVNRLQHNHLRAFWYFASKTNFALIGTFGSLLWATSPGREEAEWYRRRLAEYRWTLSVSGRPSVQVANNNTNASSPSASSVAADGSATSPAAAGTPAQQTTNHQASHGLTEFAMIMLDISTGLLKKLPEKPSLSRSASVSDVAGAVGRPGGLPSGADSAAPFDAARRRGSLLAMSYGGPGVMSSSPSSGAVGQGPLQHPAVSAGAAAAVAAAAAASSRGPASPGAGGARFSVGPPASRSSGNAARGGIGRLREDDDELDGDDDLDEDDEDELDEDDEGGSSGRGGDDEDMEDYADTRKNSASEPRRTS